LTIFPAVCSFNVAGYDSSAIKPRLFHSRKKLALPEALDSIVANDPRYQPDAYVFCATPSILRPAAEENQGRHGASCGWNRNAPSGVRTNYASRIRADGDYGIFCSGEFIAAKISGTWSSLIEREFSEDGGRFAGGFQERI